MIAVDVLECGPDLMPGSGVDHAEGYVEKFASVDELLAWLARDPEPIRENHEEGNEPATPEEIE